MEFYEEYVAPLPAVNARQFEGIPPQHSNRFTAITIDPDKTDEGPLLLSSN